MNVLDKAKAFSRTVRLRNAAEFRAVYQRGARRASRSFVVFALQNSSGLSRFGVTVPRKLGRACERNAIKRRVREIIRTSRERIPGGYDFVVNPRRSAKERSFVDVRSELLSLLEVPA